MQTPRGQTAAGRARTTRAGAKERAGREKSSAAMTHADAFFFFAGLAPARAASLELRFPLGRREEVATPVSREAFGAKEEASSFPRGSSRNALKMSSSGEESEENELRKKNHFFFNLFVC